MTNLSLSVLLSALPMPTLAIEQNERIVAANDSALSLLGNGAVGRHFITILRQPTMVEAVELALKDTQTQPVAYLGQDSIFDVHIRRAGPGGPLIVSFHDVTQLAETGQMRRDFVANVSHELRTPLTSLMGFIETLQVSARDDATARDRFLEIMTAEAGRMNRLVGDLLSLSRVESVERVRPTEKLDLVEVLKTTLCNIKPLSDEANVTFETDLDQPSMIVLGDSDQLVQVFTNLAENAIKYGGNDQTVHVRASTVSHDRSLRGPAVYVEVKDNGRGIAPEHLPRLTERFYRADTHRSRTMGGTGLGLAIVKHILNRHRGRLGITSEPGQGAVFAVTLPLSMPA